MHTIWNIAVDSVGCEAGATVQFEAQVMVAGLISCGVPGSMVYVG